MMEYENKRFIPIEKTGQRPVFSASYFEGNAGEGAVSLWIHGQMCTHDVCSYTDEITFRAVVPRALAPYHGILRVFCDDSGRVLRFPLEMQWMGTQTPAALCYTVVIAAEELCEEGQQSALLYYRFEFDTPYGHCLLSKAEEDFTPILRFRDENIHAFQLTVTMPRKEMALGLRGGIMYHVFVDRFYRGDVGTPPTPLREDAVLNTDWYHGVPQHAKIPGGDVPNNEFFGGNLYGIRDKLPYLASLGVTILYLSPVFRAYSNHKYDTGDYETVDEMFGGDDAFAALLSAAHAQGIAVICDGVFNHTGDDSRYFNRYGHYADVGAYQSKTSPYYAWYRFQTWPDVYESWWGVKVLPGLHSGNADFRAYICGEGGVLQKWMRLGVFGWRLDVADELHDQFLDDLYIRVKAENPDAVIYGEVWEDASNKIAYDHRRRYLRGGQLDSVMNYLFRDGIISFVRDGSAESLCRAVQTVVRHYPAESVALLMNLIGTHDTERILTVLAADPCGDLDNDALAEKQMDPRQRERGRSLVKLASLLQFTLPGIPCIYYGDEAGMEGYRDPFNRRPYPWGKEDTQLLAWYQMLGKLRGAHQAALSDGEIDILTAENGVFAYRRGAGDHAVTVIVNRGRDPYWLDGPWLDALTQCTYMDGISVQPDCGVWLIRR